MIYNLYSVQADGSKVFISSHNTLSEAQSAQTDVTLIYSIEEWSSNSATVLQ